ncbi:MAG: DASS family sodium-coupled anion symporter [candidate division WOR-3 bacterium]|nr:DASS family sodium-coupled anion symporter [candidate division WOR-3 bacterium]
MRKERGIFDILIIFIGPIGFLAFQLLPIEFHVKIVLGTIFWVALWWIFEAVPLIITSFIPLVVSSISGYIPMKEISKSYAEPVIFLFLGCFILAKAIEKHNVHLFLLNLLLRLFPKNELGMFLGFSLTVFFLSMWITNTSATLIALSIISSIPRSNLTKVLALSSAYSSNIGGISTLVGTPPNMIYAGMMKNLNIEVSFWSWFKFAFPYALTLEFIFILFAINVFRIGFKKVDIEISYQKLSKEGKITLMVFIFTIFLWIFSSYFKFLDETTIILISSIFLVVFKIVDLEDIRKIHWDTLFVFGGGFALSQMLMKSEIIENTVVNLGLSPLIVLITMAIITLLITEISSNTSTASLLIPISIEMARSLNLKVSGLSAVIAIGSSTGFMMPIGTPSNMLAYSLGFVSFKEMVKYGVFLDLISVILNILITYNFSP